MPLRDPRYQLPDQNCVRGDAHTYTLTVVKRNLDGTVTPRNLTTYGTSWSALLRMFPDALLSYPWAVNTDNAATGVLVLTLTAAQTLAMPLPVGDALFGTYTYDLQVTGGTVTPQTSFWGRLNLWKDDTHG